jgi:HPt (histidine-containing phosphotransfer) domain-containing protein
MLTIDDLRSFGADTKAGLNRCMNNEKLYILLVTKALQDANFDRLVSAVDANDRKAAFEAVHVLKGVMGNLSLTPLFDVVSVMTELLRTGQEADYSTLLEQLLQKREELIAMQNS